jgi:hypothetical protein
LQKDPQQRPFNARAVQGLIKDHLIDEYGEDLSQLTQDLPPLEEVRSDDGIHWGRLAIGLLAIGGLIAAAMLMDR